MSFANPNIFQTAKKYLVSLFLPSEGNDASESGDLVYEFDIPDVDEELAVHDKN